MTLEETIKSLPEQIRLELGIRFLEIGLPIWDKFAKESAENLTYYAFLLGLEVVDPKIIASSIEFGKEWLLPKSAASQAILEADLKELTERFSMHLSGIRDWELELDPSPQLMFYAASNFLYYINGERLSPSNESMIYVSINQSIDAISKEKLLTWEEIKAILKSYQ